MTYATFIPAPGVTRMVATGPVDAIAAHVRESFPGAVVHGTSVNDGSVEFGKLVAHDVDGNIWQRDPFTGTMMSAGNIADRLAAR